MGQAAFSGPKRLGGISIPELLANLSQATANCRMTATTCPSGLESGGGRGQCHGESKAPQRRIRMPNSNPPRGLQASQGLPSPACHSGSLPGALMGAKLQGPHRQQPQPCPQSRRPVCVAAQSPFHLGGSELLLNGKLPPTEPWASLSAKSGGGEHGALRNPPAHLSLSPRLAWARQPSHSGRCGRCGLWDKSSTLGSEPGWLALLCSIREAAPILLRPAISS